MLKLFKIVAIITIITNVVRAQEKSPFDSEKYEKAKKDFTFFDAYDPWEPFNRHMYKFNRQADTYVIKPITNGYKYITPKVVQTSITNIFANIMEIPVFVNSLLQLKGKKVVVTAERFVVNTTVGILGIWDPATKWCNLMKYNEDFGQTLGYYGVPTGPYLILPILGPSDCRDGFGTVVDKVGMSMLYPSDTSSGVKIAVTALQGIDTRANAKLMYGEMHSMFEYLKLRAIYLHARKLQVTDGEIEESASK